MKAKNSMALKQELRLREELLSIYHGKFVNQNPNLEELSQNIGVCKSYLSKFLNGRLERTSPKLLRRIQIFVKSNSITPSDQRLMVDIMKLLDKADDEGSILAALVSTRGGHLH